MTRRWVLLATGRAHVEHRPGATPCGLARLRDDPWTDVATDVAINLCGHCQKYDPANGRIVQPRAIGETR